MSFKEISAFFISDQCLFGAYPTQHQIYELEEWGVDLIVNLTNKHEKNIRFYSTLVKTLNFTILDNDVPKNIREFCALVIYLTKQIDLNKKIYIHCKGGHGRSGVLVASILCHKFRITPYESIRLTTRYHSTRPTHARRPKMNEYWKNKGSPQTEKQKQFVIELFQPYVITENSPFNEKGIWVRTFDFNIQPNLFYDYVDTFLMDTNLGPIEGNNGYELEQYRNSLIENLVFF